MSANLSKLTLCFAVYYNIQCAAQPNALNARARSQINFARATERVFKVINKVLQGITSKLHLILCMVCMVPYIYVCYVVGLRVVVCAQKVQVHEVDSFYILFCSQ